MLREYSRTTSESLAQIRATITEAELKHFFLKDCFLAHHVDNYDGDTVQLKMRANWAVFYLHRIGGGI